MASKLEHLAGFYGENAHCDAREACLAALQPVIARLQRQGIPAGAIIAALALATSRICDEPDRH